MLIAILFLFLQTPAAPSGLAATVDPSSVPYATYAAGCTGKGLVPFDSASYYSYRIDTNSHKYCSAPTASPDFPGQMEWR